MLRDPLYWVGWVALSFAAAINGSVAYWLHTEPKLQTAYLYPATYEELRTIVAASLVMLAFALYAAVELRSAVLLLAAGLPLIVFGFFVDEALVVHQGWMQAGVGLALLAAFAAKLRRDYAWHQDTLYGREP